MFGFFAPARIDIPRPDCAMNVRESSARRPAEISSSMIGVVMMTRSNASPASTRFFSCVDGSYTMVTLSPDDCSNRGSSSSTTALTPFVQSTLISAALADVARARTAISESMRVSITKPLCPQSSVVASSAVASLMLPNEVEYRPIERLWLLPVRRMAGFWNDQRLGVLHVPGEHSQYRRRRDHIGVAG